MMRRLVVLCILSAVVIAGAWFSREVNAYEPEEITLVQGEFYGLPVNTPDRVSIDNPSIVDIVHKIQSKGGRSQIFRVQIDTHDVRAHGPEYLTGVAAGSAPHIKDAISRLYI